MCFALYSVCSKHIHADMYSVNDDRNARMLQYKAYSYSMLKKEGDENYWLGEWLLVTHKAIC
jgi:hypothetical protein